MRRWFKRLVLWFRAMWAARGKLGPFAAWRVARLLTMPHPTWDQLSETLPPRPDPDVRAAELKLVQDTQPQPVDGRSGRRRGGGQPP